MGLGPCRPFTGAWIETMKTLKSKVNNGRPFTGAWIETGVTEGHKYDVRVAPSRGRGLKHQAHGGHCGNHGRPFTGAWIETLLIFAPLSAWESRPFTGAWIETTLSAIQK